MARTKKNKATVNAVSAAFQHELDDWEEMERLQTEAFLERAPGAADYMIGLMEQELAAARALFKHPSLGNHVAATYQTSVHGKAVMLGDIRIELMLEWAARQLGLEWRAEYGIDEDNAGDCRTILYAGPAKFELSSGGVLSTTEQDNSRHGPPMRAIERVVMVALWKEIPQQFWPEDLKLPVLARDDAAEASQSDDPALRKWMAVQGVQYVE